jgi:hypothetical protein
MTDKPATLTEQITRNMPGGRASRDIPWRQIIRETLPWTAALADDELGEMAKELEAAANHWAETGDSRRITEVEEDWRATVDLRSDQEALDHIARPDRKYLRW